MKVNITVLIQYTCATIKKNFIPSQEQAQLDLTEDRILQYLTQKTITIAIDQPPNTEAGPTQPVSSREEERHNKQGEDSFEDVSKQQLNPGDPKNSDTATLESSTLTTPLAATQPVAMTTASVEEVEPQSEDLSSQGKATDQPVTDNAGDEHSNQNENSTLQTSTSEEPKDSMDTVEDITLSAVVTSSPPHSPSTEPPFGKDTTSSPPHSPSEEPPSGKDTTEYSDSQEIPSSTEEVEKSSKPKASEEDIPKPSEEFESKASEEGKVKSLEEIELNPSEEVKPKSSGDAECVASDTEPVSKKRNFHITALSVVSFPVARLPVGSTVTPEAPTTVLITGMTVFRDGKFVPVLMLHKLAYLMKRGQQKSQKSPPSTVHLPPIPDPLDDYMYMDVSMVTPSSSWEAPSKPSTDSPSLPASLGFGQGFVLEGNFGSEGMPEIKQIVPLDGGRLLAIACCVATPVSLFSEDKTDSQITILFLLPLNKNGQISTDSFRRIPTDKPIVCVHAISEDTLDAPNTIEASSTNPALLAVLFKGGQVAVYDCNEDTPTLVACYDCPTDSSLELVDCVYSPATGHLAVASTEGSVWLLKLKEQSVESRDSSELEAFKQGESCLLRSAKK